MTKESDAEQVQRLRETLSKAKLRTTAARIAVLRKLESAATPLTHAEVAEELVPLGFDKATVFRNLVDLVDAGLAWRTELGDHVWRFELQDPSHPDRGDHPHFVCVDCGSVTCLHDVTIPGTARTGWEQAGRVTEILLKGHCKSCIG